MREYLDEKTLGPDQVTLLGKVFDACWEEIAPDSVIDHLDRERMRRRLAHAVLQTYFAYPAATPEQLNERALNRYWRK